MGPRPVESYGEFLKRLNSALEDGRTEVRYGRHHFSHAVCLEDGVFRVRCLEVTKEEFEAYRKEHRIVTPENREAISKPRTLVFEADTLEAILEHLKPAWPTPR